MSPGSKRTWRSWRRLSKPAAKIVIDKSRLGAILSTISKAVVNKGLDVWSRKVTSTNLAAFLFLSLFAIILKKGGSE